jgi:hypothetical protein
LPDLDAPHLVWPNERLGNQYKINYELSLYGLPPQGDNAYRNLHLRHLLMKTPGTIGSFLNTVSNSSRRFTINSSSSSSHTKISHNLFLGKPSRNLSLEPSSNNCRRSVSKIDGQRTSKSEKYVKTMALVATIMLTVILD